MLAGISNYFTSSTESPLHTAMRKNRVTETGLLLSEGANPSCTDASGYSVIDHAIYDGQIQQLPSLFSVEGNGAKISPQGSKEIEFLAHSKDLSDLKEALSSFTPGMLADKSSGSYKSFIAFLNESKDQAGPMGSQLIHLVALFGNEASLKLALEQNPERIFVKDIFGNTPLHYSAYNKDESCFVELVKQGSNLFGVNSSGETALGFLVDRVQKEDPLSWDRRDTFMFVSSWLPVTFAAARESGILPAALLPILDPEGLAGDILSIAATVSWLSVLLGQFSSKPKKVLFALAFLGTAWVPIIKLPMQTYMAYVFFKRAYQGIKAGWNELGHRPFKAICLAGVKASNAYDAGQKFHEVWQDFHRDWSLASRCAKFAGYAFNFVTNTQKTFLSFAENFNGDYTKVFTDFFDPDTLEEYNTKVVGECGEYQAPIIEKEVNANYLNYTKCSLDVAAKKSSEVIDGVAENIRSWLSTPDLKAKGEENPASEEFVELYNSASELIGEFYNNNFKPFVIDSATYCPESLLKGGESGYSECLAAKINQYFAGFYQYFAEFYTLFQGECPNYSSPENLKELTLEARIEAAKESPRCLQAGLDILLQNSICDNKPDKLCRENKRLVHPDKHNQSYVYANLTQTINIACETLKAAYKEQCTKK